MKKRVSQMAEAIFARLDLLKSPVLRPNDLRNLLSTHRDEWNLAQSMDVARFERFLTEKGRLRRLELALPHRSETLLVWGDVSPLFIAASVKPKAYLCHATAMALHGLADGMMDTIYVNHEQRPLPSPEGPLIQRGIDAAFRRPQRLTKNRVAMGTHELCVLNGKHTGRAGVIDMQDEHGRAIPVTGLVRTLIDITVRPAYAGGPMTVAEAYRRAAGRFAVSELAELLDRLDYVYPYHQAVGFYLERSGRYPATEVERFGSPPFSHRFYIDYAMTKPHYSKRWSLYYPHDLP